MNTQFESERGILLDFVSGKRICPNHEPGVVLVASSEPADVADAHTRFSTRPSNDSCLICGIPVDLTDLHYLTWDTGECRRIHPECKRQTERHEHN